MLFRTIIGLIALFFTASCSGGGGGSSSGNGSAPPGAAPPQPTPTPTVSTTSSDALNDLSGLDVILTIETAESFVRDEGTFPTSGVLTRSYSNDGTMYSRTITAGNVSFSGEYDYRNLNETMSRETTNLPNRQMYETTYTFETPTSGTWTESYNLGDVTYAGTFRTQPTQVRTDSSGKVRREMLHEGDIREYVVHFPIQYSPDENLPLVVVIHGWSGSAYPMISGTDFDDVANEERFVIVAPQGRILDGGKTNWNNGQFTGNDIGFIHDVIDAVEADYGINPANVFVTGHSAGAFMTTRVACRWPGEVSGMAPVAGHLTYNLRETGCDVPTLLIHGTSDVTVPIDGKTDAYTSTYEAARVQAVAQGCEESFSETVLEDIDPDDGTRTTLREYDECPDGKGVEFYIIRGGGHTWPGSPSTTLSPRNSGDFHAATLIWEFFEQFIEE